MKKIASLIIAVLLVSIVAAQTNQHIVYLKNGSLVKGDLIEKIEGSHVKLQTIDGEIWKFKMDEVASIESVATPQKNSDVQVSEKGFYNITDLGFLMGNSYSYLTTTVSAQTVSGYKINPHIAVGLGVGIESFDVTLAPVFAEGRYSFCSGRTSPFIALQAGYGVPLNNWKNSADEWANKGGVLLNGNIGISHYFSSNAGLVLSAGYRYQKSATEDVYYPLIDVDYSETTKTIYHYNRVVMRIGFLFN